MFFNFLTVQSQFFLKCISFWKRIFFTSMLFLYILSGMFCIFHISECFNMCCFFHFTHSAHGNCLPINRVGWFSLEPLLWFFLPGKWGGLYINWYNSPAAHGLGREPEQGPSGGGGRGQSLAPSSSLCQGSALRMSSIGTASVTCHSQFEPGCSLVLLHLEFAPDALTFSLLEWPREPWNPSVF